MQHNNIYSLSSQFQQSAIDMVVMTTHAYIQETRAQMAATPDHEWKGGCGKKNYLVELKARLLVEDRYFNAHQGKMKDSNRRWTRFCNDCTEYALLHADVNQQPVGLIHPSAWDRETFINAEGMANIRPDVVPGVPHAFN